MIFLFHLIPSIIITVHVEDDIVPANVSGKLHQASSALQFIAHLSLQLHL